MSNGNPQTTDNAGLAQKVDAAAKECTALLQTLAYTRRLRSMLILLVIGFVAIICLVSYQWFMNITGEQNVKRLQDLAQQRLEQNQDRYVRELQALINTASPVLTEAFSEQVKKDLPAYMKSLESERDVFLKSIEDKLSKNIDAHYQVLVGNQKQAIEEEFPQMKDPKQRERIVDHIFKAYQRLAKKYYIDKMEDEIRQLESQWNKFPAASMPKAGEPSLEDQFVVELLDMLKFKLSHPHGLALR